VLTHNPIKKLGGKAIQYLQNITQTSYTNLEVIIIDNASTDGTPQTLEKLFTKHKNVKIIRLKENYGYAGGNNQGFEEADKNIKYAAFLNNDVEVEPDWLQKIIEVMEQDPLIGAAQPKILQLKNRMLIDSLGGVIDRLGRAYDLGHGLPDMPNLKKPFEVFYARGAAIVVRADLFRKLKGFDEDYFIYYEETDFCWRLKLLGYKVVTVPTSVIYHLGGGTTGGATPHTIYLRRRNQLTTLIKNYSLKHLIQYGSQLTLRYIAVATMRAIKKDQTSAKALIKAIQDIVTNHRKIMLKRAKIQGLRKISDREILKSMLDPKRYEELVSYLVDEY